MIRRWDAAEFAAVFPWVEQVLADWRGDMHGQSRESLRRAARLIALKEGVTGPLEFSNPAFKRIYTRLYRRAERGRFELSAPHQGIGGSRPKLTEAQRRARKNESARTKQKELLKENREFRQKLGLVGRRGW